MTVRSVRDDDEWAVRDIEQGLCLLPAGADDTHEIDPQGLYELHLTGEELLGLL